LTKFDAAKRATAAAIDELVDGTHFAVVAGTERAVPVYPAEGGLAQASTATKAAAAVAVDGLRPNGSTYVVRPADAGKAISVVVTGTKAGYDTATSTAAATGASQGAQTFVSVDAPKKVKVGQKAKLKVAVTASGATPTGSIEVTIHGKKVAAKALADGTVKIKLPKAKHPGKIKAVVTYVPDGGFQSSSTTVKIKVVRR